MSENRCAQHFRGVVRSVSLSLRLQPTFVIIQLTYTDTRAFSLACIRARLPREFAKLENWQGAPINVDPISVKNSANSDTADNLLTLNIQLLSAHGRVRYFILQTQVQLVLFFFTKIQL